MRPGSAEVVGGGNRMSAEGLIAALVILLLVALLIVGRIMSRGPDS